MRAPITAVCTSTIIRRWLSSNARQSLQSVIPCVSRCYARVAMPPKTTRWPSGRPMSERTLPNSFVCRGCLQTIIRRPSPATDLRQCYCCRACKLWAFNHKDGTPRIPRRQKRQKPPLPLCAICGISPVGRRGSKFCSPPCRAEDARRQTAAKRYRTFPLRARDMQCGECSRLFTVTFREGDGSRRRFCSVACSRRAFRRGQKHPESRARRAGVPYEYGIKPEQVFDRDGWRCQLCGHRTPRSLRGKNQPRSPEVDHIVPIAAGGGHTWDNVQCACRSCNIKKKARPQGQLRLAV